MIKKHYPCILLMNDMHISKDDIREFTANWNEAVSICERMNIQEIALGGDLFQSRVSQTLDVLLAVRDAIVHAANHGIHITLANGNHDLVNQESIRGYCHVFDQHPNITIVDDFLTISQPNWEFDLHMIAYFPENGSFIDKLSALIGGGLSDEKLNYLYIHEGINGAIAKVSEDQLPVHLFKDFDKTFVGHYHNRIIIPETAIEYIGSSRQHNFGEDTEKGYTILFTDGCQEFIQNEANIRYKVIDVPVEKSGPELIALIDEIKADGRYKIKVRIHSSPTKSSTIDKAAIVESGASKVEIITEKTDVKEVESTDLFEKFDSYKLQETYQRFCEEKNIEDKNLGLSYLAKINIPCGN